MTVLRNLTAIMESPTAYRLWQAPFVKRKFSPILVHNDIDRVRRVLDVGCGPGTNCRFFKHGEYLGLDINPRYIAHARRRYRGAFQVADVTEYEVDHGLQFDFILVNSLLHHLSDAKCSQLLKHLTTVLSEDGHIHVIELVLPTKRGIPRQLALSDRGEYPRPYRRWKEIFAEFFEPVILQPFTINLMGCALWNLLYFKGLARR